MENVKKQGFGGGYTAYFFVGGFFLGVLIVFGVILLNEKTIVVPDDFATINRQSMKPIQEISLLDDQ
ncbi:hypothetical protein [Jeotgalibacillus marinus]|uniref:Uncharacterized protein n=1 Tax=Jeotgalibacillus marinus TaxID=86667 RepID=A0ABV3Q7C3_9BACL